MKIYNLTQDYFNKVSKTLYMMQNSYPDNKVKFKLSFINDEHPEHKFMVDKINLCGEDFYGPIKSVEKPFVHIVKIETIDGEYIGFITFEDIKDFSDIDEWITNLVTIFVKPKFRRKKIASMILMGLLLYNHDENINLVISEPNLIMNEIIKNSVMNLIELVKNNYIQFDNDGGDKFIEHIGGTGLMIKVNHFSKHRFDTKDIKIVKDEHEHFKYRMERYVSDGSEQSININIGGYMYGFNKCIENGLPPFYTNCLFFISHRE